MELCAAPCMAVSGKPLHMVFQRQEFRIYSALTQFLTRWSPLIRRYCSATAMKITCSQPLPFSYKWAQTNP